LQQERYRCLSIKEFLVTEQCPDSWRAFDLYVFRDRDVVFYVGQSRLAFDRVWQHIGGGFKGRSVIGQFILCNWPRSMRFSIELQSSKSDSFAYVGNDLDAAETLLITQLSPCFNSALNYHPTALPERYSSPHGPIRCSRNLKRLIREASYAVKADQRRKLLDEIGSR
jgi:hypothetical protein